MYTFHSRVRYSEIDETQAMTLPALINYFQDCSTFQSEDLGVGLEVLTERGKAWILSSWQIVTERLPKLGEEIAVSTWPTGFEGLYGTRNFQMKDKKGNMLAYANSIWVYMDMEKGRPARPLPEEIAVYQTEKPLEMTYAPRKIELPKETQDKPSFAVLHSQIDTNHHVNNCQYVQMALDVLPECTDAKQIRVEYKKSVVFGDMIYPKTAVEKDRKVVEFCDVEGKIFAVVEFCI